MKPQSAQSSKSNRTNVLLATVAILSLIGATAFLAVFGKAKEPDYVNSDVVKQFVDPASDQVSGANSHSIAARPATYGEPGGARTLVLFDEKSRESEVLAILAGNLATHFGEVTVRAVSEYQPLEVNGYDAVIYQGYEQKQEFPAHLVADLRSTTARILWSSLNLPKLAGATGSAELAEFVQRYGIDPNQIQPASGQAATVINYKGKGLPRHAGSRPIAYVPASDPTKVTVLGTAQCGTEFDAQPCEGAPRDLPWALRTDNLTYVADIPFEWHEPGTHYLAYADLLFELLAPNTPASAVPRAAVRIEDVNPMSDPEHLRRVADYLSAENVPFQVAVIPYYVAETADDPGEHLGVALGDKPEVVKALKYMQSKGGELIQHGTTHQFGTLHNPYPGAASAADFEFIRAQCARNNEGAPEVEECKQDSWVRLTGPVPLDGVSDHAQRVEEGRRAFIDAGLGEPTLFEVPHYAATPNAYEAIGQHYDTRYEQSTYFPGLLRRENESFAGSFTQVLPYSVRDIYGGRVLPENLGNPSVEMLNNHEARPPALIVRNAEKGLVVREPVASFFFHPFLDIGILSEIVTGIKGLGYSFVPAKEL